MFTSKKYPLSLDINSIQQFNLAVRIVNMEFNLNLNERDFFGDFDERTHQLCLEIKKGKDINCGGYKEINSNKIFKKVNSILNESMLSNEDIKTHFNDDRFCNFCWSIIYNLKVNNTEPPVKNFELFPNTDRVDRKISPILYGPFTLSALNIKQRRKTLIDCIQYSDTTIHEKKSALDGFIGIWEESLGRDESLKWLDQNNTDDCKWCYEYMINSKLLKDIFKPSEHDYFWALAAAIDLTLEPRDIKLLMLQMKKSFSQRKYREKHPELKAYSIKMTQETKDKLDEIVSKKDKKIHKIIEELIEREYRSLV